MFPGVRPTDIFRYYDEKFLIIYSIRQVGPELSMRKKFARLQSKQSKQEQQEQQQNSQNKNSEKDNSKKQGVHPTDHR